MGTQVHTFPKPIDDTRAAATLSAMPPNTSTTCPPETPPMTDPTNFRYPRSWTPAFHDSTPPSTDIFASPDPTAMYSAMALPSPSPLLRDFYQGTSPMIGMLPPYFNPEHAESRAQRAEKLSVVCEEMNGLFANLPNNPPEPENRSDNNVEGEASNISSPEHEQLDKETSTKAESIPEQTQTTTTTTVAANVKCRQHTSQSSSETRPVLDTSSLSPSSSPQLIDTRVMRKADTKARNSEGLSLRDTQKKSSSRSEKGKRPPSRPQVQAKSQPMLTNLPSANMAASALAAANAFAMNPALAGLIPFAGPIGAGIPQMYPAGAMFYQGRPMAFVPGARGPELIPIDMLAQAQAAQFGAQALQVAGQMNNNAVVSPVTASQSGSPYESAGSSRKKRRRQMLERSGCSEEEARENRARALKRLRQKKTVRSQSTAVRYACRKRIAMVRPRVNGRFATKEEVEQSQQEALDKK